MKTKQIKRAVKNAMKIYYKSGLTNTAFNVQQSIFNQLDKINRKK